MTQYANKKAFFAWKKLVILYSKSIAFDSDSYCFRRQKSLIIFWQNWEIPTIVKKVDHQNSPSLKVRQIRNDFFKPTFLPKKERTNSTLLLVDLFSFVFWKKVKTPRSSTCPLTGFFWLLSHVIYLKLTRVL